MIMKKNVILITGASSGIGFETAKMLASFGHIVYGTSRSMDRLEKLKEFGVNLLELDVSIDESCKNCINRIIEKEGKIDVLINNAGFGSYGPIETVSIEDAKKQFEVNVYGVIRVTQLVIPYMRDNGYGRIINVSSAGGRVTTYLGGWYHASKYALEALSDSLRMELKEFGIEVSIIEPGGVKSNWGLITADNLLKAGKESPYEEICTKVSNVYKMMYGGDSKLMTKPEKVAKIISKAVNKKHPKTRYLFGFGARPMLFMHCILPNKAFDYIMKKMYKI